MINTANKSQQFCNLCLSISKALLVIGVLFALFFTMNIAKAVNVYNRYIKISSGLAGANNVTYDIGFTIPSAQIVGSMAIEVCDNSPLYGIPCTAPAGFDWTNSNINSQSGVTGLTIDPTSTSNRLVLTRMAGPIAPNTIQNIMIQNVTNPTTDGTFFGKIYTYPTNDATGPDTDFGAVAMHLNPAVDVTAVVPPYLYFCSGITISAFDCGTATGGYINLGELSKASPKSATSQLVAATNADFGFNITISGTTLTSGNNIIPSLFSPTVSKTGSSGFGINLRGNSTPGVGSDTTGAGIASPSADYNIPNRYKFVSGDTVASTNDVTLENKFTVSYVVNVDQAQKPGVYSSTFIYNILASF